MSATETDIRFGQYRDSEFWWWKFIVNDKVLKKGSATNRVDAIQAAREARRQWEEPTCETCGGDLDEPAITCPNCKLG